MGERLAATNGQWVQPRTVAAQSRDEAKRRIGSLASAVASAERKLDRAHSAWIEAEEDMEDVASRAQTKARTQPGRTKRHCAGTKKAATSKGPIPCPWRLSSFNVGF